MVEVFSMGSGGWKDFWIIIEDFDRICKQQCLLLYLSFAYGLVLLLHFVFAFFYVF